MMTKVTQNHFQKLRKLVGIVIGSMICFVFLAFSWQALIVQASLVSDDPDIQISQIEANLPLYNPDDSSVLERVVYFDNSQGGNITTTLAISGTPSFTVTAAPAFGLPATSYNLASTGMLTIPYQVTVAEESQPGVQYTLVNTYGVEATAVISYLRDITQPVSTLDNLPPGGFLVTTPDSTLLITGTVRDDQSGVKAVWLDPATGAYEQADLGDAGDWVQATTWSYTWAVPEVDSGDYTLRYYAEDNIGQIEIYQVYTITVNNDPVANDDFYNTPKNSVLEIPPRGVLENDSDPRNRNLTAVLVMPPAVGTLQLNQNGSFDYTPPTGFVGDISFTYKANNGQKDSNIATVTISVFETDSYVYLPLITKPQFMATGEIGFYESERFKGVTTFRLQLPLDFSGISFTYTPQEMKVWLGNTEPTQGWRPYASTYLFPLNSPIVGGQEVHVKFRYGGDEIQKSTSFFYIPNGDFRDGRTGVESHWSPQNSGLPWSVINNRLRLGSDQYGCSNMPFPASAEAMIALTVPGPGYKLHVEAVVYTYDKLPDPNQAIYDAFEISVGSQRTRHGYSGPELLNCQTERTVPVNSVFDLSSGNQIVRLENWSRFDNYYNTYTDVVRVWVEK